jgi:hypothetical protein
MKQEPLQQSSCFKRRPRRLSDGSLQPEPLPQAHEYRFEIPLMTTSTDPSRPAMRLRHCCHATKNWTPPTLSRQREWDAPPPSHCTLSFENEKKLLSSTKRGTTCRQGNILSCLNLQEKKRFIAGSQKCIKVKSYVGKQNVQLPVAYKATIASHAIFLNYV